MLRDAPLFDQNCELFALDCSLGDKLVSQAMDMPFVRQGMSRQACSPAVVDTSVALLDGCAKSGAALKAIVHILEQTCTRS